MTSHLRIIFVIICLTFGSILFSLLIGSTEISLTQLFSRYSPSAINILWDIRLPRTLTAFITGALLALSGAFMQLLTQNPLADPYVLGISGGAALVTLCMMLCGFNGEWLIIGAWLGSLMTILCIFMLVKKHQWQTQLLLLSGIALACGFSAGITFILLISPDKNLHTMLFWLTGDLNDIRLPWIGLLILLIGGIASYILAPGLNILARGDKESQILGLSYKKYRIALYLLSSLFTAAAVSLAGCIGFIGLIVPHITRLLVGFDHRIVLPLSMLLGGSLLTIADTCARSLFAPQQLPVGILMAMIGVPIFIWLIQK
jgi:iron complex transport system permease protein